MLLPPTRCNTLKTESLVRLLEHERERPAVCGLFSFIEEDSNLEGVTQSQRSCPARRRAPALAERGDGRTPLRLLNRQAAGLPTLLVEHELPLVERVPTARALRAAGEPVRSIASQLGVDLRIAYLAAGTCSGCRGPALSGLLCSDCHSRRGRPAMTHKEALEALRAWAAEHGEPPRAPDWTDGCAMWNGALRAAGPALHLEMRIVDVRIQAALQA